MGNCNCNNSIYSLGGETVTPPSRWSRMKSRVKRITHLRHDILSFCCIVGLVAARAALTVIKVVLFIVFPWCIPIYLFYKLRDILA